MTSGETLPFSSRNGFFTDNFSLVEKRAVSYFFADKNESVFFLGWARAGLIGTDPITYGVCPN
jgi:hypothetical protein